MEVLFGLEIYGIFNELKLCVLLRLVIVLETNENVGEKE